MFIGCCARIAWTAEVTIVRRVQPPSQPPPAGGRRRVPALGGGGSGRGPAPCPRRRGAGTAPALPGHGHWALGAMRMTVSRDHRGTRFLHPPPAGGFGRAWPARRGMGNPGFPTLRPREASGGRSPPGITYGHPIGMRRSPSRASVPPLTNRNDALASRQGAQWPFRPASRPPPTSGPKERSTPSRSSGDPPGPGGPRRPRTGGIRAPRAPARRPRPSRRTGRRRARPVPRGWRCSLPAWAG